MSSLKNDGYIIKKNFFPKELISSLQKNAKEVFKSQFDYFKYDNKEENFESNMVKLFNEQTDVFINCGKTIQQGLIDLYKLAVNDNLICELKKQGLKKPNLCTRPVLFFNHPNLSKEEFYYKTPPHQDWGSMLGSLDSLVVWIPLIDITDENGPLMVIPKSHTDGLVTDTVIGGFSTISDMDDSLFTPIKLEYGDMLIFSSFLIHKSGVMQKNSEIRWSCHFRYNNLDDSDFIKRGYPNPYIYKPLISN